MATFLLTNGVFDPISLGDSGIGFVSQTALVAGESAAAITGGGPSGRDLSLTVRGEVAAIGQDAVDLQAGFITVTVGATGLLSSQSGLLASLASDAKLAALDLTAFIALLVNDGTISGDGAGVNLTLDGSLATGSVVNAGTIRGTEYGFNIRTTEADAEVTLENTGSIIGFRFALFSDGDFSDVADPLPDDPAITLNNSGLIWSQYAAILFGGEAVIRNSGQIVGDVYLGSGGNTLINSGVIDGTVSLGSENDLFDTRSGEVLGVVDGSGGNDTFLLNAGVAETVSGGSGVDTVVFSGPVGAVYALDGSFEAAGAAEGDSLLQVERLTGTVAGADVLRGNGLVNLLSGRGGADQLDGAGGADRLVGGPGADTLTGGLGNVIFIFNAPGHLGDVITDFTNSAGNNDRIQFSAAAFGLGAYVGVAPSGLQPIFQSRGDNLAQDANDRFIFRTTDRSLWFDADGNGAGAAVMVADLQAGATFTASDLLIL